MKKFVLLISTITAIISMAFVAFAGYPEWYYDRYGEYPEGTVLDWEEDDDYRQYLQENEPDEYERLMNGERTEPVDNPTEGNVTTSGASARITEAHLDGKTAKWTLKGYSTKFEIKLYKDGKQIDKKSTSKKSYDFSSKISTGKYYIKVRAYADNYGKWSKWCTSKKVTFGGNGKGQWKMGDIGRWTYIENGKKVKKDWRKVDGYWYYLNKDGYMCTGWVWLNNKSYYLNEYPGAGGYPFGACWMGGTTPDGYQVNNNGEWVVNGKVQHKK